MSSEQEQMSKEQAPLVDGFSHAQWRQILKTLTADPGWLMVRSMLAVGVAQANQTLFNSQEPERQNALHEAIGFLTFANKLSEIGDRARFISERGVSPDAASRESFV